MSLQWPGAEVNNAPGELQVRAQGGGVGEKQADPGYNDAELRQALFY